MENKNIKKGSALLVALLVMGVLISVSLALSVLILRESRVTKQLLDSGKAYYAAEAAIEEALYRLENELPGWENVPEKIALAEGDDTSFEYQLFNRCEDYPCIDEDDYDLESLEPAAYYDFLPIGSTATITLFYVDEGTVKTPENFQVQFFVKVGAGEFLDDFKLNDLDILRWKIFSLKYVGDNYQTESISDLEAAGVIGGAATDAKSPSWFGTKECDDDGDGVSCQIYESSVNSEFGSCNNLQARDVYLYDQNGEYQSLELCYPIKTFIDKIAVSNQGATGLAYLQLTNVFNTDFLDASDADEKSKIYYRIETDGLIARDRAKVVANGYSGRNKQSIEVEIAGGSFLPVFNFSIYAY